MWEHSGIDGRGPAADGCRQRQFYSGAVTRASLSRAKPNFIMTEPAKVQSIYRYPVKGLSPEPLARAFLGVGATVPGDRFYAIENGPSGFDPAAPRYQPKQRYLMLMRNERLAALRTHFD